MTKVRVNIFETNSSSTHSLCICTVDEFENWKMGKSFFDAEQNKFIGIGEIKSKINKRLSNTYITEQSKSKLRTILKMLDLENCDNITTDIANVLSIVLTDYIDNVYTYDKYFSDTEFESFEEEYITPKGEKIIAFGLYGYS